MVTSVHLRSCSGTPFHSKRVHGSQTLLKSPLQHLYPNFRLIWKKFSWKTSLLVRSQILGLFGNTFSADHMYSCHRWEKFPQYIQTLLSEKRRTFAVFSIAFLESTQNFSHLQKKDQLYSFIVWEVIDPEKCGSSNAHNLLFSNTLPH